MKLPPLNSLPAFEATARLGSMTAAADELGRTHGAISKQLAHLSELAGVALFERVGAGVRLTQEGERFSEVVRSALHELEAGWQNTLSIADGPVLDLGISATFAMRWLMPRMPRFYQRYPSARVNFKMTGMHRIPDRAVHLILTWDRLRWEFDGRTDIEVLGDVSFGVVHAPGLDATVQGNRLATRNRCIQELPGDVWRDYSRRTGVEIVCETATAYAHTFLVIEAVLNGFGAGLLERRLVEEELRDGRLVAPFGFHRIENGFGAIVTERRGETRLLSAFLDWLREEGS